MTDIDKALAYFKAETANIAEHLDTLKELAYRCTHVTEFGFRFGASYCALLAGLRERPSKLITYDIHIPPACRDLFGPIRGETILDFIQESTLETNLIEETDLLFVDTLHTYKQLKAELEKHGSRVRKFMAFHDTAKSAYAHRGEDGSSFGLLDAINEFIAGNPEWSVMKHYENCNGLTILVKVKAE